MLPHPRDASAALLPSNIPGTLKFPAGVGSLLLLEQYLSPQCRMLISVGESTAGEGASGEGASNQGGRRVQGLDSEFNPGAAEV